jgi:hypothetical protein
VSAPASKWTAEQSLNRAISAQCVSIGELEQARRDNYAGTFCPALHARLTAAQRICLEAQAALGELSRQAREADRRAA